MENKCVESEQIFFAKMNRYSFKLSDKKWQLDKENCVYPHKVVDRMVSAVEMNAALGRLLGVTVDFCLLS